MKTQKRRQFKKGFIQDWVDAILWAFVVAMIIRNYTFQNFKIPSSSMEQTLLIGDYLVANKMKYIFANPKQNDIVTFRNPDDPAHPGDRFIRIIPPVYWSLDKNFFVWYEKKNVVKRVIGMPGDKVEIVEKDVFINDELYRIPQEQYVSQFKPIARVVGTADDDIRFRDGRVYQNGMLSHQNVDPRFFSSYHGQCVWGDVYMGSKDNFGPVVVPEGHYFVLGDNRDMSLDSRFFGFLSKKDITGTPSLIFFSKTDDWQWRPERSFNIIR